MMMMECLIYEKGIVCGGSQVPRTFDPPRGYVTFAKKWDVIKRSPTFVKPESWPEPEVPEMAWGLMRRYPVSTSCDGRPDPVNPRGSGYYAVVVIELSERSALRRNFGLQAVIACKEQLLNRYTSATAEAWPIDALVISAAPSPPEVTIGPLPSKFSKRNGVWCTVDDELEWHASRMGEDTPSYSGYQSS
jgi:hypothetical protein